jgi:putative drug exporter of the RND superfamily
MHMFGNANWSLPGWLDRRLPHLAIEPREETPVPGPRGCANPDPMTLMAL